MKAKHVLRYQLLAFDGTPIAGFQVVGQATAWAARVLAMDVTLTDAVTGASRTLKQRPLQDGPRVSLTHIWEATFAARFASTHSASAAKQYADDAVTAAKAVLELQDDDV